jgi:hypothetical protein
MTRHSTNEGRESICRKDGLATMKLPLSGRIDELVDTIEAIFETFERP